MKIFYIIGIIALAVVAVFLVLTVINGMFF